MLDGWVSQKLCWKLSNKKAICDKDEEGQEDDVEEGQKVAQLERGPVVGEKVPSQKAGHILILKFWWCRVVYTSDLKCNIYQTHFMGDSNRFQEIEKPI